MADVVDRIEREIERDRMALTRNIRELEDRAQAAVDWRTHYQSHVSVALAAAFGGGLLLGSLSRGHRGEPSRRSMLQALDPGGRASHQISEFWGTVVAAIIGTAGAVATEGLSELVPGFRDQYEARSSGRRV